ncbi:UNVERIFIED_ORG: hypothetical protein J2740_001707 [Rhizobium nepotum]|nr:hypothetical protein [Rhizobium nepotum]
MHKQRAPQQLRPFSSRKVSDWATLRLSPEAAKDPRARAALKLQAELMRAAMSQMAIMPVDIRTMEVLGLPLAQPQPFTPDTVHRLVVEAMAKGVASYLLVPAPAMTATEVRVKHERMDLKFRRT